MLGTQQIGRYEVVGRLAMGGMAEILLGRLLGPSGFERVVVIKRILPHLAQHRAFTEMFLDEARIAAAIHHPNVVQVHELGEVDGELFLVMEYLEGETLSGLLRRLTILGERLDPALAAYVGAQACAGLHAAHEQRDGEGNLIGLVHRDVSPQNVFVTYDGAVKILDFGIAKAADRITQTEAGTLKGKFAYMSPEQCLGEAPDRRSDLFALGTVLYEAVTGRRLFHRPAQLMILRAVVEEPFPPPTDIRPEVTEALDAAILKALSRDRGARFANAAEMRRALAEAASAMGGPVVPEEALAQLMRRLFPDRIQEKAAMLQRVRSGSLLTNVPAADIDIDVELPTVEALAAPREEVAAGEPRRASRAALPTLGVVAGLAAAGLGAVGIAWAFAGDAGAPAAAPAELAAPPTAEPATPDEAPSAAPETITLRVESRPSGATVLLGGAERGQTPLELTLPRSDTALELHVRSGPLEHTQLIAPDRDRHVELILAQQRPVAPPPAPRRATRAPPRGEASAPAPAPTNDFARFD